jgi:hypothetical protein
MERNAKAPATADRWATVVTGSLGVALESQALLEHEGLATYVPDYNLKKIDPFITGSNSPSLRLQVPGSDVARINEILRRVGPLDRNGDHPAAEGEGPDDPETGAHALTGTAPEEVRARQALQALGWRTCAASLFGFTIPFAWYWAMSYAYLVRAHGVRPPNHGWVLAACFVSVALAVSAAFLPASPVATA